MSHQKGVYLKTVNYDTMFHSLSQPPIIVNEFDISNEAERERLNSLIYTRYDGDTLSNIPQCDCGGLKGEYNVGTRHIKNPDGTPGCGHLVQAITEKPLESLLWMEVPEGIPGFVNLTVWRILAKHLTYSGFNILEYLTNPFYRCANKIPPIVAKVDSLGLPMGLKNFCEHYDHIIDMLYRHRIITGRVAQRDKVYQYLKSVRDVTFTKRLPFPSKLGFITEENNGKTYADHKMAPALDAIWTIVSMYANGEDPSLKMRESRCVKAMTKLNDYYRDFETYTASKKEGIFRKLIYGTRPHWTYRAVISSLHEPHHYAELHLPWSLSVLLFKSHLNNKLLARGFTPNDMISLLYKNTLCSHVLLETLFKELIDEAPEELLEYAGRSITGISTSLGRNPTLRRGSIQHFKITKIKDDPSINTISLSTLVLKAPNADYDGDALNGQPSLDNKTAEWLKRHDPHTGVMDLNRPFRVSRHIAHPTPFLATLNHWMREGDEVSLPMEA